MKHRELLLTSEQIISKDNYSLAFVVSNLGSMDDLKNQSTKLPASVRFGGSYKYTAD